MIPIDVQNARSAIFFVRDGVVNRRSVDDYVKNWNEFDFLPATFEVVPQVIASSARAVLVTNQRGIARGLMGLPDLADVHFRMQSKLKQRSGVRFDAIYFCPHERDAG